MLAFAASAAFAQSAAPNDDQIAGIVVTANTIDVDAEKLAQKMSKNKEVKQFGEQLEATAIAQVADWRPCDGSGRRIFVVACD